MQDFFRLFNLKMQVLFGSPKKHEWLVDKSNLLVGENHQFIITLLYSYDTASKDNRWFQNPFLLEVASFIIKDICQNERMIRHRRLLPILSESYPLVVKHLPKLKLQYEKYLFKLAKHYTEEVMQRRDLTQLTSANVGYGTNHLAVELKGIAQYLNYCSKNCGAIKGLDKKFLKEFLQRFMNYMHPAGYWAESDGPALNYNTLTAVSLMGLANELGEVKKYWKNFLAVANFHTYATLPDGRYIDIMDGRNTNCAYLNRGAVLSITPEGSALYQTMITLLENSLPKYSLFAEPLALLLFDEKMKLKYGAKSSRSVWSKKKIEQKLGDFLVVKNQSWIAGASNIKFRPRPEGHFNLDYQNLLTLYHTDYGEIFGGQNSKNDPEISFFSKFMNKFDGSPVEKPMPKYIPGNGSIEYKNNSLLVNRDYRGFEGCYEIIFKNARQLEIILYARARAEEYPIQCNLILPCGVNHPIKSAKKKTITFDKKAKTLTNKETGKYIVIDEVIAPWLISKNKGKKLKITVPDSATIKWPFKPWDTYNLKTDRALNPEGWFCLMVIDLTNKPVKLLIDII